MTGGNVVDANPSPLEISWGAVMVGRGWWCVWGGNGTALRLLGGSSSLHRVSTFDTLQLYSDCGIITRRERGCNANGRSPAPLDTPMPSSAVMCRHPIC